jgi:hypothetical protein
VNARKPKKDIPLVLQTKIREMNWVYGMMYDHFNASLWRQIGKEQGFAEELEEYRQRKAEISEQCASTANWLEDHHRQVRFMVARERVMGVGVGPGRTMSRMSLDVNAVIWSHGSADEQSETMLVESN